MGFKRFSIIIGIFLAISCAKEKEAIDPDPIDDLKADELIRTYSEKLDEAEAHRNPDNGWLESGCDGLIWTGKYAASSGVVGVDILAAEFEDQPGRFGRRPPPRCWTPELGDEGSKTTFSRDMGIGGLFPWAWRTKNLDALERHAEYGKAHNWKMGEPLADGRSVYTPAMIGHLYETIYALGGEKNPARAWPAVYPKNQVDFQAHLLMMSIWLQGEVDKISEKMFERIQEQADRQNECPFYQAMSGIYTGNLVPAVDLLLSTDEPNCDYLRCEDLKGCQLAEWIWSADIVMRRLGIAQ